MNPNPPDYRQTYAPPPTLDPFDFGSGDDGYRGQALSLPASHATEWLANAWGVFKQQPLPWMVATLVYLAANFAVSLVPGIGVVLELFLAIFLGAGFVRAAAEVEYHGRFSFGDLFAGFRQQAGSLAVLGLLCILFIVAEVIILILLFMICFGLFGVAFGNLVFDSGTADAYSGGMLLLSLFLFCLTFIPFIACFYLAPALVLLQNETPLRAVALSWQAFVRNAGGALLCTLLMTMLMLLALIPFGLGLLLTLPMWLVLPYTVYRDLFFE